MSAAIAALDVLKASRIALLTPYRDSINLEMCGYFNRNGISVEISGSFRNDDDNQVCLIHSSSIKDALVRMRALADVDAMFVSCTSLRVLHFLEKVEKDLGLPIVTSNQALIWHALRLSGYNDPINGFGQLARMVAHDNGS